MESREAIEEIRKFHKAFMEQSIQPGPQMPSEELIEVIKAYYDVGVLLCISDAEKVLYLITKANAAGASIDVRALARLSRQRDTAYEIEELLAGDLIKIKRLELCASLSNQIASAKPIDAIAKKRNY